MQGYPASPIIANAGYRGGRIVGEVSNFLPSVIRLSTFLPINDGGIKVIEYIFIINFIYVLRVK